MVIALAACSRRHALGDAADCAVPADCARQEAETRRLIAALDDAAASNMPDGLRSRSVARDLAKLGAAAHSATPALVDHARRASWDERADLMGALAAVADARAVPYLTEALGYHDWRINLDAANALAKLGIDATRALPALAKMEREHWLPHARRLAAYARAQINRDDLRSSPFAGAPGPTDGDCRTNPHDEAGWKLARDVGSSSWPTGMSIENLSPGRFVTYRIAGGQFLGTELDEGEGNLSWVAANAAPKLIRDGAVFAIVAVQGQLLAIQSFAEESHTVSAVERTDAGGWIAREVLELPAAPTAFRTLPDGRLMIETRKGTLEIDRGGSVRRFECAVITSDRR